jgi:hypothetical protein
MQGARNSEIDVGKEGGHALIRESNGDEQAGLVEGSVWVDADGTR